MTAILVVLTIAVFLTVDYLHTRARRARATVPARLPLSASLAPELFARPAGVFFGPGHTWARLEPDGAVRIGIDDFAQKILGRIERIEAAPAGVTLGPEDAAFVLHQQGKSAAFPAPIEGVVAAVNEAALGDPARLKGDPFGAGWLLLVKPKQLAEGLRRLRVAEEARAWMQEEVARLRDFLSAQVPADAVGATLQDGGVPVEGVFEHLDAKSWERFEVEFLVS